jgi:CRP-like cAMP-binding protein
MIEYRVLYYPNFSPASDWLRRVLMLSDSVIRIVPSDVKPDDSEDLLRLQETIPGCLSGIAPEEGDVAIEPGDEPRLRKAFALLGKKSKTRSRKITVTIARDGSLSIAGHVFLHDSKISEFIERELRNNKLSIESLRKLSPSERFIPVREEASNIILAGLASRIARRLGVDAITDQPMPFAVAALLGVGRLGPNDGTAEGALLSAIAMLTIPASVVRISAKEFREIRDSYTGIREAFKSLTAELAARHRLTRTGTPAEFARRVEAVARDFAREYREYRHSRYARQFRSWGPLSIGGVLSIPTAFVSPLAAAGLTTASVSFTLLQNYLSEPDRTPDGRVFHMLAGLRKDVIKRSGIRELV